MLYKAPEENIKTRVDWFIILIYLVLVVAGWLSIYGASYQYEGVNNMFDLSSRAGSQLIWIGTSLLLAFVLLKLDSDFYDIFAYIIYAFFMLLLLVTVFVAPDIKGSRSWLVITESIRLQPAEFAKFAVALALAKFMNSHNFQLLTLKNLSIIVFLILLPMMLIFLQQETGSALVYTAFILVLYREGLPGIVLLSGFCAIVLFVVGLKYSETEMGIITEGEFISLLIIIVMSAFLIMGYRKAYKAGTYIFLTTVAVMGACYALSLSQLLPFGIEWVAIGCVVALIIYLLVLAKKYWSKVYLWTIVFIVSSIAFVASVNYVFTDVMQPHQQMRIKVSLGMEQDLKGAGYNVNQSKIAIGSGGLTGKGFLNGTQTKLKYVPEQDTDFIFCTVGEEQGFVGSVAVLILFMVLILRLIFLAERQKSTFARVYGYSVISILLFHITINVGMVIGLLPVIGIPLPFFSYGGSSLWAFTILLFIFLRLDMARKKR